MFGICRNRKNKSIYKIAILDVKKEKVQSILISIAFAISIALIIIFLNMILGTRTSTKEAAKMQPSAFISHVTEKQAVNIEKNDRVESVILQGTLPEVNFNEQVTLQAVYFSGNESFFEKVDGKLPQRKNEIMITSESLKYLPNGIKVGSNIDLDFGNGIKHYYVSAIATLKAEYPNRISVYCSKEILKSFNDEKYNDYTALIFLRNSLQLSNTEIENSVTEIAKQANISEENIYFSSKYKSLSTKLETKDILQAVMVILFVTFAVYLVVFSIFYITISNKINQFGQLRTVGMSSKQIYKLVMLESKITAFPGFTLGIILGIAGGYYIAPMGWTIYNALSATLIATVLLVIVQQVSARYPARKTSQISPIEAMHFNSENASEKIIDHKNHIHYSTLNFATLNLKRNKRKKVFTAISLILCGILLISVSGLQKSISAENMAKTTKFQYGEYKLSFEGNQKDLDEAESEKFGNAALQSNSNELTDSLKKKIKNIIGVKAIKEWFGTTVNFKIEGTTITDQTTIWGYQPEDEDKLEGAKKEGIVDYQKLVDNDGIILNISEKTFEDVYHYTPKIGDQISITFYQKGDESYEHTFNVMGITDKRDGFGNVIRIPLKLLENSVDYNLALDWEIVTEAKQNEAIEDELEKIIKKMNGVSFETKEQYTKTLTDLYGSGFLTMYILAIVLAGFAFISLINLAVMNERVRKRETELLLIIGMTRHQLQLTRLIENELLGIFSLMVAILVGTPLSYFVVKCFSGNGSVQQYSFPFEMFTISCLTVIVIQALLSFVINKKGKETLIESLSKTR